MPLTDASPIEKAMTKIIGTPSATSAGTAQDAVQLAPRYSAEFGGKLGDTYASSQGAAYSAPITAPTQSAFTSNTPAAVAAATPTSAVPTTPTISYSQQLYNDLALSGVKGTEADSIVRSTLAAGGWNATTPYDTSNRLMNINPDVPSGTVRTTTYKKGF